MKRRLTPPIAMRRDAAFVMSNATAPVERGVHAKRAQRLTASQRAARQQRADSGRRDSYPQRRHADGVRDVIRMRDIITSDSQ